MAVPDQVELDRRVLPDAHGFEQRAEIVNVVEHADVEEDRLVRGDPQAAPRGSLIERSKQRPINA